MTPQIILTESSKAPKLWNRDFIMLVIGQIVSLFGNGILRFALPLYILVLTGSSALFGTITAVSAIPLVLMSPIGGVVADRVNKKRIMVTLDFITASVVLIFFFVSGITPIVPATIVVLMALFAIQGMMSPAVDSCVPVLVGENNLVRANSIVFLVNSLSMMLGPAIGGVLFANFGIAPILIVAVVAFALAATMEIFIRIPNVKQNTSGSPIRVLKEDMKVGIQFMFKHKPITVKICATFFLFTVTLSPVLIIGVPVLVTQYLGYTEDMLGMAQGIMGAGGIVGGIIAGVLGNKLRVQKTHILIFFSILAVLPIGISIILGASNMVTYIVITSSITVAMCTSMIFTVRAMAFIQSVTPSEMLGKVMALVGMMALFGQPIGQFLYGQFFEVFATSPYIVIFISTISGLIIALWSRRHFKSIA